MTEISIKTNNKREIVDITEKIQPLVKGTTGIVNLFLRHTTASITTADLDPGTDLDMLDVFDKLIPQLNFRHPHNPSHTPDHILSSIIGTSLFVPIREGKLMLGAWQRIILIEFDGPRTRNIDTTILSS